MLRIGYCVVIALAFACLVVSQAAAASWIAADWAGKEPQFPPGSLYWHTSKYPTCPVVFRTVLRVDNKPLVFAGFMAKASDFAYVFLNGRQIAARADAAGEPFGVELTHLLRPGPNVLVISTKAGGFSMEGAVGYKGGRVQRFASAPDGWKVQKLAPLTILEFEPFMQPDFDDSKWFSVKATREAGVTASESDIRKQCGVLGSKRLAAWDNDARWRLKMLATKGIAIVDWEAYGWAGCERLPQWLRDLASKPQTGAPGSVHAQAEALCRYVVLSDEAVNLANHVTGLKALKAPAQAVNACAAAAKAMEAALANMKQAIETGRYEQALAASTEAQKAAEAARNGRILNGLNRCLDNKFSWFDTTRMLDSDPAGWGLKITSPAEVLTSPLSRAALVSARGNEFVIEGWGNLSPYRVYNRRQPPSVGPARLLAVTGGKVTAFKPGDDGIVYDRQANGRLDENWVLVVTDMFRGGPMPIELVFLRAPARIAFKRGKDKAGNPTNVAVTVTFAEPGAQLFILKPLAEWRGFMGMAQDMMAEPLKVDRLQRVIGPCRFWSRAVLDYPVTFSESSVRDPNDHWALIVADVYNYRHFEDQWRTKPLRLAPLPPLATYGLMMKYPGLKVIGKGKVIGSRGIWGDLVAAVDTDHIVYRVPLDPIKRFGGFTSYCFGGGDIGGPGSKREIETVKLTGSNSFRPQHNQTGERAVRTADWCRELGLQNMFNTDEKWVPDVVEHFRTLARKFKDYPADTIAYDLLNEPETRDPRAYCALLKKITAAIREIDKTHLIYVETIPPWGPGAKPFPKGAFETLEPTGDKLTVYSFHDYDYRLPPRWPNEKDDIRTLWSRWIPAFRYSIDHRAPIHLGEFGGFEQTKQNVYTNACAMTMMMDYLRIFDQFGWHWNYYANRGTLRLRKDGSLQESYVQKAHRRYFQRGTFNVHRHD